MTLVLYNNYVKDISGIKEIIGEEGIGFEMEGKLLRNWNEGEWHFDEEFKRMKIIQRRKEIINS